MPEDITKNPNFNMCPHENCTQWFYTKSQLEQHIKIDHPEAKQ